MLNNLKIRTKIVLGLIIASLPIVFIAIFFIYQLNRISQPIIYDMPKNINQMIQQSHLDSLSQSIKYYDEVLTQSARNYAFTADIKWKERYDQYAPALDGDIKEAISLGDSQDKIIFSGIETANIALIKMETDSMSAASNGNQAEAVRILESAEYGEQKKVYSDGISSYVQRRGAKYDEALLASTNNLALAVKNSQNYINQTKFSVIILIAILALIVAFLWLLLSNLIVDPLYKLRDAAKAVTSGKSDIKIEFFGNNVISDLADSFNQMVDKLFKTNANIEKKVAERTAQLARMNELMVGRELEMIKLKKEINELKKQIR